jgi:hypothetical protein
MMANFNLICHKLIKKSQFTGFFVFMLLLGCQPAEVTDNSLMQQAQTDAKAANTLAAKRLATNELAAALHWLQQAAQLGDTAALAHSLQLQQRLEGKLATAHWLAQAIADQHIQFDALNARQRQQLGLWSENDNLVSVFGYTSPNGCAVTIQPVVSQLAGVERWQLLLQQWQQHPELSSLAVCFSAMQHVDSIELNCTEQSEQRIRCQYQPLQQLITATEVSQLLVIAGRGKASYNNGIIQLPDNATLALLQHEFLHVLGFIDEYPLPLSSAEQVCQSRQIHPNIVLNNNIQAYLAHWQLHLAELNLTAVQSCDAVGIQAYRIVSAINPMHFYETDMPPLYWQLARKALQRPEQIMPVQYYFAYLARQQQDWLLWQQFMQQASNLGYVKAQQALRL